MTQQVNHLDLRATVYPLHVPEGLAAELPQLYESLCSTQEWFVVHDRVRPQGVCVLDEPRHVLLFIINAGTIEILNKAIVIAAADVERACRALFRTFPHAHRLRLDVAFNPQELRLPTRILSSSTHDFILLPGSSEDYIASLSKSTRRHLRRNTAMLQADFPSIQTEVVDGSSAQQYLPLFMSWKNDWFKRHGRTAVWETDPGQSEMFAELVRRCGSAHLTRIEGEPASIRFDFRVGNTVFGVHSAFDPALSKYGMGLLMIYWLVCDAIEQGAERVGLMWGGEAYKKKLGAQSMVVTRASVFPRQRDRLRSLSEATDVLRRRLRRIVWVGYRRTRHSVGRVVRRQRSPAGTEAQRRASNQS